MLSKLIKYEFNKRWKAARFILLGYIILQSFLLIVTKRFLKNLDMISFSSNYMENLQKMNSSFVFIILFYFALAVFIYIFPFIESIYRFERDLSGKQAVLELMIPVASWKKVASKLISSLVITLVGFGLAGLSIVSFIAINGSVDAVINMLLHIMQSPLKSILIFLYGLFGFVSNYMMFFLCIAFSKSLSYKNKIAVPIGIIAFVVYVAVISFFEIQVGKFPIYKYTVFGIETSLSVTIVSLLGSICSFFGTSWLLDNKVEHYEE